VSDWWRVAAADSATRTGSAPYKQLISTNRYEFMRQNVSLQQAYFPERQK